MLASKLKSCLSDAEKLEDNHGTILMCVGWVLKQLEKETMSEKGWRLARQLQEAYLRERPATPACPAAELTNKPRPDLSAKSAKALVSLLHTVEAVVSDDVDNGEDPMAILKRDAQTARLALRFLS